MLQTMLVSFGTKALMALLPNIIDLVTPELRTMLCKAFDNAYAKARTTESPIDDLVVQGLAKLVKYDVAGSYSSKQGEE